MPLAMVYERSVVLWFPGETAGDVEVESQMKVVDPLSLKPCFLRLSFLRVVLGTP